MHCRVHCHGKHLLNLIYEQSFQLVYSQFLILSAPINTILPSETDKPPWTTTHIYTTHTFRLVEISTSSNSNHLDPNRPHHCRCATGLYPWNLYWQTQFFTTLLTTFGNYSSCSLTIIEITLNLRHKLVESSEAVIKQKSWQSSLAPTVLHFILWTFPSPKVTSLHFTLNSALLFQSPIHNADRINSICSSVEHYSPLLLPHSPYCCLPS